MKKKFKMNATGNNILGMRQFYILFVVAFLRIHTVSEIAKFSQQSASSMSLTISKLVKNGYLYKKCPYTQEDKRKVYFYLTKEGEKLLEEQTEDILKDIALFYEEFPESKKGYFKQGVLSCLSLFSDWQHADLALLGAFHTAGEKDIIAREVLTATVYLASWIKINTKGKKTQALEECPVNPGLIPVLKSIDKNNAHSIKELTNVLPMSGGAISIAVSQLAKDGYLIKNNLRNHGDGRKVYLEVTNKGREAMVETQVAIRNILWAKFQRMKPEKRAVVYQMIQYFNKAFSQGE